MSGVYISGMEMPKRGHTVTITIVGSGETYVEYYDCKPHVEETIKYQAIPVPDHGRLIDADSKTFPTFHRKELNDYMKGWNACLRSVQQQPTIIPADPAVMRYPQVPGITPTVISDTEEDV